MATTEHNKMQMVTTGLAVLSENDEILSGFERYSILGDAVSGKKVSEILAAYSGLKKHWDCIEKAEMAQALLGRGRVVLGSLMVTSGDGKSEYGYYFNPPYEFHAWLVLGSGLIFDAALPGVIEKGLTTRDAQGPYIIDRKPVVLAGRPLGWMRYRRMQRWMA